MGRHQERGRVCVHMCECVHRGTGNAGRGDNLLPPLQEELWELIGGDESLPRAALHRCACKLLPRQSSNVHCAGGSGQQGIQAS